MDGLLSVSISALPSALNSFLYVPPLRATSLRVNIPAHQGNSSVARVISKRRLHLVQPLRDCGRLLITFLSSPLLSSPLLSSLLNTHCWCNARHVIYSLSNRVRALIFRHCFFNFLVLCVQVVRNAPTKTFLQTANLARNHW
jgi:hypothetical protein